MEKAYLVILKPDNTRDKTYARGVHYQIIEPQPIKEVNEQGEETITGYTEEQIIPLVSGFNAQELVENGAKWLTNEEYLNLLQTGTYSAIPADIYIEGISNA